MEKIKIWFSIQNGGDGSAYPMWLLTKKDADRDQDTMDEGWGEPCNGSVETFIGSDIHLRACENSFFKLNKIKMVEKILKEYYFYCPECKKRNRLLDIEKPLKETECEHCYKIIKLPDFSRY